MLNDFHTHLDFYKSEELEEQLAEFSGTIVAATVDEKSYLANVAISNHTKTTARACRRACQFLEALKEVAAQNEKGSILYVRTAHETHL